MRIVKGKSNESNDDEETTTEVDFSEHENSPSVVLEINHPGKIEFSTGDQIVVNCLVALVQLWSELI